MHTFHRADAHRTRPASIAWGTSTKAHSPADQRPSRKRTARCFEVRVWTYLSGWLPILPGTASTASGDWDKYGATCSVGVGWLAAVTVAASSRAEAGAAEKTRAVVEGAAVTYPNVIAFTAVILQTELRSSDWYWYYQSPAHPHPHPQIHSALRA